MTAHEKPIEEFSLDEAQEQLKKLVEQREKIETAISVYKKYIKKIINRM